jgi:hypothetical protein
VVKRGLPAEALISEEALMCDILVGFFGFDVYVLLEIALCVLLFFFFFFG